jgi:hypothetical protein
MRHEPQGESGRLAGSGRADSQAWCGFSRDPSGAETLLTGSCSIGRVDEDTGGDPRKFPTTLMTHGVERVDRRRRPVLVF